jgi:hypothetical protein
MSKRRRRTAASMSIAGRPFDPTKSVADPNFKPVSIEHAKEGWRAWVIDRTKPRFGLPVKMSSVSHGYEWTPRRKAEAECGMCSQPGQEGVPGVGCSCGFYSAKSLKHLMRMGYHLYHDIDEAKQFKVVGQVACWGKVIEGTQGWRTQYAYPTYLMVPFEMGFDWSRLLKDSYGCKVRLLNFLKQPDEITDEFLEALMAGKAPQTPVRSASQRGRRVAHRALQFTGRVASDPYERAGKRVIDVVWDVTPDRTVPIKFDDLQFEAH